MDTLNISCTCGDLRGQRCAQLHDKSCYNRGNILKIYFTLVVAAAHLHKISNNKKISFVNQRYSSTEQNIQYLFHYTNTGKWQIAPWVWIRMQYLLMLPMQNAFALMLLQL